MNVEFSLIINTRVPPDNQGASPGERGHPKLEEVFRPGPSESLPRSGSGGGRQGTDPLPALGRTRPWVLEMRCLDTYELLNKSLVTLS